MQCKVTHYLLFFLLAPGVSTYSTIPRDKGTYGYKSGTSMATPHVAGCAALLWSYNHTCSAQQIRRILLKSAFNLGQGECNNEYGQGLVQIKAAVDMLDEFGCGAADGDPLLGPDGLNSGDGTCSHGPPPPPTPAPTPFMCPSGQVLVEIDLLTDKYAEETSWTLTDGMSNVVDEHVYQDAEDSTLFYHFTCVNKGDVYEFTIMDSYGDGICCGYGLGSYNLTCGGVAMVMNGGDFSSSETTIIDVPQDTSEEPSFSPSNSLAPSIEPTDAPSDAPTSQPSSEPSTDAPSANPTDSSQPSLLPSPEPSVSINPTDPGTSSPTKSASPSLEPSGVPSRKPSSKPSLAPSDQPSSKPSHVPSKDPTLSPSSEPSSMPSQVPSDSPTKSAQPSSMPSENPTKSNAPSQMPSDKPSTSQAPSSMPSDKPTQSSAPSKMPSSTPSEQPSTGDICANADKSLCKNLKGEGCKWDKNSDPQKCYNKNARRGIRGL